MAAGRNASRASYKACRTDSRKGTFAHQRVIHPCIHILSPSGHVYWCLGDPRDVNAGAPFPTGARGTRAMQLPIAGESTAYLARDVRTMWQETGATAASS